jgi:rare lipoprotein A
MKILLIILLGVICITQNVHADNGKKIHKILEQNYQKYLILDGYNAEGKAIFYGNKFHNRKTASGIRHSKYACTAASVKLPLMSVVKVTNKKNGKSISVLINDRGPFKTNAVLDLSKAAANAISLRSTDNILIEFDLQQTLELIKNTKKLKNFGI